MPVAIELLTFANVSVRVLFPEESVDILSVCLCVLCLCQRIPLSVPLSVAPSYTPSLCACSLAVPVASCSCSSLCVFLRLAFSCLVASFPVVFCSVLFLSSLFLSCPVLCGVDGMCAGLFVCLLAHATVYCTNRLSHTVTLAEFRAPSW